VFLVGWEQRFIMQELPFIDPIPFRLAGYFANCLMQIGGRRLNQLAKVSVVRAPVDLE